MAVDSSGARLVEVQRDFGILGHVGPKGRPGPTDFDTVWDAHTIGDRRRLVRALVRRIEVDETTGEARAILTDLGLEDQASDDEPAGPPRHASAPTALAEETA